MKKLLIIVSIVLFAGIVSLAYIDKEISSSEVGLIVKPPISNYPRFRIIRKSNGKSIDDIKNWQLLNEFYHKVEKKAAKRIPGKEGIKISKEATFIMEYNGGKEALFVDKDGRIISSLDKGDIRNTSRIHWLWWKIDCLSDNYTGVYYITEEDNSISEYIKKNFFEND